jgi:hypothetical protein
MHRSSYDHMEDVTRRYLGDRRSGVVLDVGSQDINGSYRGLFTPDRWRYIGLDLVPGSNVDVVAATSYQFPLATESVDVVITGQAFEHVEYFWLSWLEMVRVTAVDGLLFLIAPSRGVEHRHPVDCWRFYPDSLQALAKWGGVPLLEGSTDWARHPDPNSAEWGDTVGVFRKVKPSWKRRIGTRLICTLGRRMGLHADETLG